MSISLSTSCNVVVLLHTGTVSLGFMMSAAVLVPSLREISSSEDALHNARAMSKADKTPRSSPASCRTTIWRRVVSPRGCSRINDAASNKGQDDRTVKMSSKSLGEYAACVLNHWPTLTFGSAPAE